MAGVYLHIPFCKKRCIYCDFYKSTDVSEIELYIKTLKRELWFRRDYLSDPHIETIYFGGGTPSVLSSSQIKEILDAVKSVFKVNSEAEITMEMNPDDMSFEYLREIRSIGVNRLSIGVQSFNDNTLKYLGRRHDSKRALDAVVYSKRAGFDNISIDLIYGIPGITKEQWKQDLETAFNLGIQHVSAYHLTYHEGTLLWNELKKGNVKEISEEESRDQFFELIRSSEQNDFIQYEVSNFCLEGFYSKHNSSYWKQAEYLGLGPSAHSFDIRSRQWNISDIKKYLSSDFSGNDYFEKEELTTKDRFNDYVLTSLRTIWGIDLAYIKRNFGEKYLKHILKIYEIYIETPDVIKENDIIKLTKKGYFISDKIISDFMY